MIATSDFCRASAANANIVSAGTLPNHQIADSILKLVVGTLNILGYHISIRTFGQSPTLGVHLQKSWKIQSSGSGHPFANRQRPLTARVSV
jgi:hypothetical protein